VSAAAGRVVLRRPTTRDRDEFLEGVGASRRLHRPWVSPPRTREEFDRFLRRGRRADVEQLVVCRRKDGVIVGTFNLSQIFYGSLRSAYLGYYAFEPFAGQGYMSEGLQLVLRHAFASLHLHRVEANVQPGNEPSLALIRRAGFRQEGFSPSYLKIGGRWRDHERWAITAEDRRTKRR
jgi:[ribosomal protein S5]-alanine N-acetyltransferase